MIKTALASILLCTAAPALDEIQISQRIKILERASQFAEAVTYYEAWQKLAPDKVHVTHGYARALDAISEHQRIVDLLDAWLDSRPEDHVGALLLGDAYRELGNSESAVASWRRALDKANTASYGQVADRCRAAGLRQEAIRVLRAARKIEPALYNWELASLHLEENDYRSAIERFVANLRQTPQRLPVIANRLETVCRTEGNAVLETLASISIDEPLLLAHLTASCALAAGQPEVGLAVLATLDDRGAEHLFQFAGRVEALGHDQTAARAYGLFADRLPGSPLRYQALSRQAALTALRNGDAALALYRRMTKDFPDRPETLQTLVGMARLQLEERNNVNGAIATLRTVVDSPRRGPWTPQALALIAECNLRLGNLEQSERFLSALEKNDSMVYEARFRQAELHYFRGDFAATDSLLTALSANDLSHPLANDAFDLLLLIDAYAQTSALATLSRAQFFERRGLADEAAAHWTWLATHAEPTLAEHSLLLQAQAREHAGQYAQAIALYERQIDHFPEGLYVTDARLALADLYERRGAIDRALKTCEIALLQRPDDARAPALRLRILRLRQLHEKG